MDPQEAALENLRVIRSLMGRATSYRAISATAALVGGLLALAGSCWLFLGDSFLEDPEFTPLRFLSVWLGILAIASIVNLILLGRGAARREERFFNPSFRTALTAVLPALLTGGALGIAAALHGAYLFTAIIWTSCYGLALLATRAFAPRSIRWLGYAFVATSIAVTGAMIIFTLNGDLGDDIMDGDFQGMVGLMLLGDTFGLYHLIYGIAVLATHRKPAADTLAHPA